MKPTRIRMCHSLVMNYGLYKKMEIFVSKSLLRAERHRGPLTRSRELNLLPSAKCPNSTRMNTSISCIV